MAERGPGPDHPITVTANPGRVIIWLGGRIVADSRRALTLLEPNYAAVQYIPRADPGMMQLQRSEHATWCPYKGECSYFHIAAGGNAIWSYEAPHEAVAMIREHRTFFAERVDRIEML